MSSEKSFHLTEPDRKGQSQEVRRYRRYAMKSDAGSQIDKRSARQTLTRVDVRKAQESITGVTPLWIKFGARMFGSDLDRRLAEGEAPESSRLMEERIQQIVAPRAREVLARNWLAIFTQSDESVKLFDLRVPVVHDRIIVAEAEIRAMIVALMAPLPNAQGVAMSRWLLSDGAGPLYNAQCTLDLGSRLRQIGKHLDPLTP
jgi:hypothetical protein